MLKKTYNPKEVDMEKLTFEMRDEFKRKKFAERVISIINSYEDLSPIIIDGQWGTGKTEFCHKMINLIKQSIDNQNITPIYVDSFAEDYYDQALVSILVALYQAFPNDAAKKELLRHCSSILKALIKVGSQSVMSKCFGLDGSDAAKEFLNALKDEEKTQLEETFIERSEMGQKLESLKKLLKKHTKNQKIILFIDELDRCRPNFTIQMLESIKHIFDIKGLTIVLIANFSQIVASIQNTYGISNETAQQYMQKFYKLRVKLPDIVTLEDGNKIKTASQYFGVLFKNENLENSHIFKGKYSQDIQKLFCELVTKYHFSLRDVEKLTLNLRIYDLLFKNITNAAYGYKLIISFAIFSVTREAPWIDGYLDNKENFPNLFSELRVEKHKTSSIVTPMEQIYDCLSSSTNETRHYFNSYPVELEQRRGFFWKVLNEIKNFEILK